MTMMRYTKGMSNGGVVSATTGEALTDDQLRAVVPSIFATEAHESRSARFTPIPTVDVLTGLRQEGFDPFFAQQSRTRVAGKAEYTKHLLRLRHRSLANAKGDAFEIILLNANDGTSAYQMIPGFFRFVCANGLFAGEKFEDIKVRHSGQAMNDVIEGAYTVLENAPRVVEQVETFKVLTLDREEQQAFAEAALAMRYPAPAMPAETDGMSEQELAEAQAEVENWRAPVDADRLLRPRRMADTGADLWTTFNRVQENAVKGGLRGHTIGKDGRHRRTSTRPVTGIDQTKNLNRLLWDFTARVAELKAA
jgi:hypothetical protein